MSLDLMLDGFSAHHPMDVALTDETIEYFVIMLDRCLLGYVLTGTSMPTSHSH